MNQLTNDDRQTLVEAAITLRKIRDGEKVFFNVALFERLGVVEAHPTYYTDFTGAVQVLNHNWKLTRRGHLVITFADAEERQRNGLVRKYV